jgi:dTDP-glucose 4,6-dehydratase
LLVTGGAGFIGSNFVHHWVREHPQDRLIVLDALTYAGNLASLQEVLQRPGVDFVRASVCDREQVERLLREERLDTIVHFAAESHVDRSISGPEVFIQTNVLGTHCLLEAARAVWLKERTVPQHRFHHVSTDEVYGSLGPADPAFTETTAYAPNSPYAASKAASDHLVRAYHHTYGLETTISNCSNNYGPRHFPEKLIPLVIINILHGKPLPIYGDGKNVRDWLHVEDHCRGIAAILETGIAGEVYNIGGRSECENLELVRLLCEIADESFRDQPQLRSQFPQCPAAQGQSAATLISFVKDRPGHDRRYAINCDKIERDLGFSPSHSLAAGLRATFAWYVQNTVWWRSVLDGEYRTWIERQYGQPREAAASGNA